MVFHWSSRDNMFLQVSRTLPSMVVDLNNAVDWTVSTPPLISKSFRVFLINLCGIVPSEPITISITVTFKFNILFWFSTKVQIFSFLFAFFEFFLSSAKFTVWLALLFLLTIIRSGCLVEIR